MAELTFSIARAARALPVRAGAAVLAFALAACAPLPQRTGLPVEQRPSHNFDERRPNLVILHHTGNNSVARALRALTDTTRRVSSHYLVARDGRIYHLVDELARAWHAGESYWGGIRDLNSASIGIELDNNGEEPYAEAQIRSLLALLADLKERYRIPRANFLGHGDVAPRRKTDPGRAFPWKRLADGGFGLWCDAPGAPATPDHDDATLLAAFGYDVSDLDAALAAFRRRFAPRDGSGGLAADERALLHCLVSRKRAARDE